MDFQDDSRFSSSSTSRRDTSTRERQFKDFEILKSKVENAQYLWREFKNMVDGDGGVRNETFLDFTKFIRDNSDYIKSLTAEMNDRSPVGYPSSSAEASTQLKISLTKELSELQKMIDSRKKENLMLKKLEERFSKATQAIGSVMDEAESKKEEEETIDAIERKLLDLKFEDAKNRLNHILKTVFPNKDQVAVSNLLEKLFGNEENDNKEDRWLELGDEDRSLVQCLLRSNIIQMNDENTSEFLLLET